MSLHSNTQRKRLRTSEELSKLRRFLRLTSVAKRIKTKRIIIEEYLFIKQWNYPLVPAVDRQYTLSPSVYNTRNLLVVGKIDL